MRAAKEPEERADRQQLFGSYAFRFDCITIQLYVSQTVTNVSRLDASARHGWRKLAGGKTTGGVGLRTRRVPYGCTISQVHVVTGATYLYEY